MNITRVFPVNNNKQNTAFSGQKDIAVDNPLSRIPAADVFENEVSEEAEEPKAIPEFDATSSDDDKNELIIKE